MRIRLPLPTSKNQSHKGAYGGGRQLLTAKAKAWQDEANLTLNQMDLIPLRGPVSAWLFVYMPFPHKGDAHNHEELLWDILQGRAYLNDAQIVERHVYRRYDPDDPRVEMSIEPAVDYVIPKRTRKKVA